MRYLLPNRIVGFEPCRCCMLQLALPKLQNDWKKKIPTPCYIKKLRELKNDDTFEMTACTKKTYAMEWHPIGIVSNNCHLWLYLDQKFGEVVFLNKSLIQIQPKTRENRISNSQASEV